MCNYELFNTEFKTVAQSGFEIVQDRCNHVTTDLIFVNAISCSPKGWEVIVQPANDAPLKKKVFEAAFSAVLRGCEAWFNLPLKSTETLSKAGVKKKKLLCLECGTQQTTSLIYKMSA